MGVPLLASGHKKVTGVIPPKGHDLAPEFCDFRVRRRGPGVFVSATNHIGVTTNR